MNRQHPQVSGSPTTSAFAKFREMEKQTQAVRFPKPPVKTAPTSEKTTVPSDTGLPPESTAKLLDNGSAKKPVETSSHGPKVEVGKTTTPFAALLQQKKAPSPEPKTTTSAPTEVAPPKTHSVTGQPLSELLASTGPSRVGTEKGVSPDQMLAKFNGKEGVFVTTITKDGYQFEGCDLHVEDPAHKSVLFSEGRKCVSHIRSDVPQELMSLDGGRTKASRFMGVLRDVELNAGRIFDISPTDKSSNGKVDGPTMAEQGKSKEAVGELLDSNLKTQKADRKKGNNEIQLFNLDRNTVVGFLWEPTPKDASPMFRQKDNSETFDPKVAAQYQNYIDGICNGPSDGKGQYAKESFRTNERDSFTVYRYATGPKGSELVPVATFQPTPGRTFDPKTGAFSTPARTDFVMHK